MAHPDPNGPPDLTPIRVREVWENPTTRERAEILELPYENELARITVILTAPAGSRVVGEHRHPTVVEQFTAIEGELSVSLNGKRSVLRPGETAVARAGEWHDWWNATDLDAKVRVEVTPAARLAHMIETLYGLARLGFTDAKGMPHPLQLALFAREFSDVVEFRKPPPAVQKAIFGLMSPIALALGYRATYPQISRSVLAPIADSVEANS